MPNLPPVKKTLRGSPLTALKPTLEKPKVDFESAGSKAEVFYQMTGMEALIANIGMLPKFYKDVAGFEMANIAADVIQDAKDVYVPYQFGALRDSGGSDEYNATQAPEITEIGMWFAGPAPLGMGSAGRKVGHASMTGQFGSLAQEGLHVEDPTSYALIQHEDPSFKHPIVGPVAQPQYKYLETPMLKMVPQVLPRIAKAIEEAGGSL